VTELRAAVYARVSTAEQRLDAQRDELARYVAARGWTIACEFDDRGVSGSRDRRPGLDGLLAAVRRREVDVVVVAGFDRFARSVRHLVDALAEFGALGVQFVSVREQIDTTTPGGRMAFHVFAAVAEFERELIRERVRAGMAAARRRGKRVGRPRRVFDLDAARAVLGAGGSRRAAARAAGVGARTLARALAERGQGATQGAAKGSASGGGVEAVDSLPAGVAATPAHKE
jgi:DNA invertase Pin-like site-specific DNA recombinase